MNITSITVRAMYRVVLVSGLLALTPHPAQAVIVTMLWDPQGEDMSARAVYDVAAVKTFRADLDRVRDVLLRQNQSGIEQLLGPPVGKIDMTAFAMPVAEYRGFSMSGFGYADPAKNKNHTEFYQVGDDAAVQVWYGVSGDTPAMAIFYLRTDWSFPKLTSHNLGCRLTWDQQRLQRAVRFIVNARQVQTTTAGAIAGGPSAIGDGLGELAYRPIVRSVGGTCLCWLGGTEVGQRLVVLTGILAVLGYMATRRFRRQVARLAEAAHNPLRS